MAKKKQPTKFKLNTRSAIIGGVVALVVAAGAFFLYNTMASSNALYVSGFGCHSTPTLRQGSKGSCVKYVQNEINYKVLKPCYKYEINRDGVFGAKTVDAVKKFQKKFGLKADGVVGPGTWKAIVKGNFPCGYGYVK